MTISSTVSGLSFTASGTGCEPGFYSTPSVLNWSPGASCMVAFSTPQSGTPGTVYVFTGWSDGGVTANPRTIVTPGSASTYTATFKIQYQLTTGVSPAGGGTASGAGYYDSSFSAPIGATPSPGYQFLNWTGPAAAASNPATTVTMSGPRSVTANFQPIGSHVDFILHGSGGTANPPNLFLDSTAAAGVAAKYADSTSVKLSGGNSWKAIGTWGAAPSLISGSLNNPGSLTVWLGLQNSDDQGTRFDVRGELYRNGSLVTSGETFCINGVTRNPSSALQVTLSIAAASGVTFDGTSDGLSLRILTRIGTDGAGAFCGGHSNAVGLRLYFDASNRASHLQM